MAVQRRHGVGAMAGLEREHRHAELFAPVVRVDAAKREERLVRQAERVAQRSEVLFDQLCREAVVARRHRRVRREHDLRGDPPHRLVEIDPLDLHPPTDQLQRRKRAVAFVEVHDTGRDAERGQRLHAADAEQQLLADAHALIAAVQPRRQLAILRAVAFDVRIEQQQRVAADGRLPDARHDPSGARLDLDGDRRAGGIAGSIGSTR